MAHSRYHEVMPEAGEGEREGRKTMATRYVKISWLLAYIPPHFLYYFIPTLACLLVYTCTSTFKDSPP